MGRQVMTPVFRASYAHVFTPKEDLGGKLKYSVAMLFDKSEDLSELKAIVKEAINEKWGGKPPKGLKSPFKDGDANDNEKGDDYKNKIYINASSVTKPGVVDSQVNAILDTTEFYSGCYARATVNAYAYDVKVNKGVAFGLRNIQKIKDGEPLGGRNKAEHDFSAIPQSDQPQEDNSSLFGDLSGTATDLEL